MRIATAISLLLCLLSTRTTSAEETSGVNWEFHSSATCASNSEFRKDLERLLTAWDGESQLDFHVTVDAVEDTWAVSLRVRDGGKTFQRNVEVKDCSLASKVGALLVAITLDPGLASSQESMEIMGAMEEAPLEPSSDLTSSGDGEDGEQEVPNDMEPPARVSAEAAAVNIKEVKFMTHKGKPRPMLSLSLALGFGLLPSPSPGPAAEFIIILGRLRLHAGMEALFSAAKTVPGEEPGELKTKLMSFKLGAAYGFGEEKVRFYPGLGLATQTIFARTEGIEATNTSTSTTFAPSVGADILWFIVDNFGLQLGASLQFPMAKLRFVVDGAGTVHSTSFVVGLTKIGIFFGF